MFTSSHPFYESLEIRKNPQFRFQSFSYRFLLLFGRHIADVFPAFHLKNPIFNRIIFRNAPDWELQEKKWSSESCFRSGKCLYFIFRSLFTSFPRRIRKAFTVVQKKIFTFKYFFLHFERLLNIRFSKRCILSTALPNFYATLWWLNKNKIP